MSAEAQQTVREYTITAAGGGGLSPSEFAFNSVMDTAYCLSKLNHRLYRQGRQYTVKVDAHRDSIGTNSVEVYALMPTWFLRSAWRMAKRAYDDAMKDELAELNPNNVARWRDFRVGSGVAASTLGGDAIELGGLVPYQYQIDTWLGVGNEPVLTGFTSGEYNLSYAHNLDTGVNMKWWLSGGTAEFFGIFEEYAKSRNESASPETVITEMPYEALKAEGEDDDYQELQANGNEPPYNADTFPNAIWVRVGVLEKSTDMSRMSTGFFTAPLGLVCLRNTTVGVDAGSQFSVEIKGGTYNGVHAPSM